MPAPPPVTPPVPPPPELLKGTLAGVVLALLAERPGHGYDLARRAEGRTNGLLRLREGTLYPLLHDLVGRGWVTAAWETVEGRRRRVYALTPLGRHALRTRQAQWRSFASAIDAVLFPIPQGGVA